MIKDSRTAFYGIGRVFYKCYFKCELSDFLNNSYYLLDAGSRMPFAADDKQLRILSPEAIGELDIENVIITISGAYDLDSIVSELSDKYPGAEFSMWYD
jgi:hypothetical protein